MPYSVKDDMMISMITHLEGTTKDLNHNYFHKKLQHNGLRFCVSNLISSFYSLVSYLLPSLEMMMFYYYLYEAKVVVFIGDFYTFSGSIEGWVYPLIHISGEFTRLRHAVFLFSTKSFPS